MEKNNQYPSNRRQPLIHDISKVDTTPIVNVRGSFDLRKKKSAVDLRKKKHVLLQQRKGKSLNQSFVRESRLSVILENKQLAKQLLKIQTKRTQISTHRSRKYSHASSSDTYSLGLFLAFSSALLLLLVTSTTIHKSFLSTQRALSQTSQAFAQFETAANDVQLFRFQDARQHFNDASHSFAQSQEDIKGISLIVQQLINSLPIRIYKTSGFNLLESGESLSRAGSELAQAANLVMANDILKDQVPFSQSFQPSEQIKSNNPDLPQQGLSPSEILHAVTIHLDNAIADIEHATQLLDKINTALFPQSMKEQIEKIRSFSNLGLTNLKQFSDISHLALTFIGHDQQKRYLVTFHNNNEIRSSFGFIGTYAIIDFSQGRIKNIEVDGIYNIDGQLLEKMNPPEPISHLTPRWYLHDANWFADFPTSAEKMMWFYEKAGGPTVDGVISLTPNVIEDLLTLTGPIPMPDYNTVITNENFVDQTQIEVEEEYNRQLNQPKKFIADLAPIFLKKLLEKPDNFASINEIIQQAFHEKQIGLYSSNTETQEEIKNIGWGAEIKQTDKDYLLVADNNIGGGKTDRLINQSIDQDITIHNDGSVIKKITIQRDFDLHTAPFANSALSNVKNINWMRLYVPENSVLLEAKGFDLIHQIERNPEFSDDPLIREQEDNATIHPQSNTRISRESGKSVFENWNSTEPNTTTTVELIYRLPFTISKMNPLSSAETYSLLLQKQSGSKNQHHNITIHYPNSLKPTFTYPPQAIVHEQDNTITLETILDTDAYFATTFETQ